MARGKPTGDTLFEHRAKASGALDSEAPLAERMRPRTLQEFVGQSHLVGPTKLLYRAIHEDRVPSMILWGPPGVGKTSLARLVAASTKAEFVSFSAVLGSIAELRTLVSEAKERRSYHGKRTILFVDEIHRFNKGQQDAFLPHVEDGSILLIGATTENPSFSINAALLSRCKVFRLEALGPADLVRLLGHALSDDTRGLGKSGVTAGEGALEAIASLSAGDARRALTSLEVATRFVKDQGGTVLTTEAIGIAEEHRPLLYDKTGDEHHAVTSAFIKSMRGSDPDAAVYWMMRMIEAGDDPLFVLRRMIIFASEDVGNADPRALMVVTAADAAFRRVGMPEGLYPIAQACTYLAATPKSNASNLAFHRAKELIERHGALPVPKKLRPGSTGLNRSMGYGKDYKYAHDYEGGVVPGEHYLPDELHDVSLYEPTERGEEARIKARLSQIRSVRNQKPEGE